jgi:hypothetical protein
VAATAHDGREGGLCPVVVQLRHGVVEVRPHGEYLVALAHGGDGVSRFVVQNLA